MIGKLAELFIFGLAPLVFASLLLPNTSTAGEITVSGEVFYRERIALPPNAVLTVQLSDVSLADAPASTIAEQKIDPAGQVPIKFEIKFDPAVTQPKASYALQARITVDDQLWFINDQRYAVDPLKPEPQNMLLKKVSQSSEAPPTLTIWRAPRISIEPSVTGTEGHLSSTSLPFALIVSGLPEGRSVTTKGLTRVGFSSFTGRGSNSSSGGISFCQI